MKYTRRQLLEAIEYWQRKLNSMNEGFTDTRLPKDRVKRHETGLSDKYWVAVEDASELLTNYGFYVSPKFERIPVSGNATPPRTTSLEKACELASRVADRWPDKYVILGKDSSSRGVMTQKNHLRGGAVLDCWIPGMRYWRDGVVPGTLQNSGLVNEAEIEGKATVSEVVAQIEGVLNDITTQWKNPARADVIMKSNLHIGMNGRHSHVGDISSLAEEDGKVKLFLKRAHMNGRTRGPVTECMTVMDALDALKSISNQNEEVVVVETFNNDDPVYKRLGVEKKPVESQIVAVDGTPISGIWLRI